MADFDPDDFRQLRAEVADMKTLMGRMTDALTRLALLEERQQAVSGVTSKILEQVESIRASQHEAEIRFASYGDVVKRVERVEQAFRDLHIERERDKASLRTVAWLARGAWALIAAGGLVWVARLVNIIGAA